MAIFRHIEGIIQADERAVPDLAVNSQRDGKQEQAD
jgi:hypothetical protein